MVEPAFEDLARDRSGPDVAFVKVSLDVPTGQGVAAGLGISATPTFLFFAEGRKVTQVLQWVVPGYHSGFKTMIGGRVKRRG